MPIHLDLDWREAQLGQLSRLVLGSDPGWRGDLTGEMHVDGTAEAAQVKTRLAATGVHRAEFAPPDALDFDANCSFVYHYSARSVEKLSCDSPLGDGPHRADRRSARQTRRPGSPSKRSAFPSVQVSTSCAPCAADSTPTSRPAEPSAARSPTTPLPRNADAAQTPSPHTRPQGSAIRSLFPANRVARSPAASPSQACVSAAEA